MKPLVLCDFSKQERDVGTSQEEHSTSVHDLATPLEDIRFHRSDGKSPAVFVPAFNNHVPSIFSFLMLIKDYRAIGFKSLE